MSFALTSKFLRPRYCYYYFKLHTSPFLIALINKPIQTSTLHTKRLYSIEERNGIQEARIRNLSYNDNTRRHRSSLVALCNSALYYTHVHRSSSMAQII